MAELRSKTGYHDLRKSTRMWSAGRCIFPDTACGRQIAGTGDHGTTYGGNPFVGAAVSAVFDQFKACDILGHVKEVAPYLEQKLDELVEKYDFLVTRRGKGLMQGVVCKLPVGKVAAAALEQGLIVITAGADVLRFVPPLVIEKQHVDEMIEKLEKALLSVQE